MYVPANTFYIDNMSGLNPVFPAYYQQNWSYSNNREHSNPTTDTFVNCIYDAHGTVVMPSGLIYYDCLRVHSDITTVTTRYVSQPPYTYVDTTCAVQYDWYKAGIPTVLFSLQSDENPTDPYGVDVSLVKYYDEFYGHSFPSFDENFLIEPADPSTLDDIHLNFTISFGADSTIFHVNVYELMTDITLNGEFYSYK